MRERNALTTDADIAPARARRGIVRADLGRSYSAFQARVNTTGKRPSVVLRDLVAAWLACDETDFQRAGRRRFIDMPGRVDGATRRVEIKLTDSECEAAAATARADGLTLNRWVAAGVRARLTAGVQLGEGELQALAAASAQLGAIGRNLNQVARSLNIEGVGADRYPDHGLLLEIEAQVAAQAKQLRKVLLSNQRRWSLREV